MQGRLCVFYRFNQNQVCRFGFTGVNQLKTFGFQMSLLEFFHNLQHLLCRVYDFRIRKALLKKPDNVFSC